MATTETGDDAKPLKTDRRITIDGGLNTRASCLNVQANQATALGNFRLRTTGALQKRRGGLQLFQVPIYGNFSALLPTVKLADAGAGGLPAGTFDVAYTIGTVSVLPGGATTSGLSLFTASAALGASRSLNILIPSVNSGQGVGNDPSANPAFLDEPQNGGVLISGAGSASGFGIYVKKVGDPNFTLQVVSDLGSSPLGAFEGHLFKLNAYTTTGPVAPSGPGLGATLPVPIRTMIWHPLIDALIGISADYPWASSPLFSAPNLPFSLALSNDSAGNSFGFSRIPTRIFSTFLDRCLIVSDGVGRPKILNTPANSQGIYGIDVPTVWSFRMLGAAAPTPPVTIGAKAGGALTGVYQYAYTWTYLRTRQDGTTFQSESNLSPAASVTYAAQQAPISLTVSALETGVVSWNLYRTVSGGSQFFLLATQILATTTVNDNNADASLNGQQPPGQGGNIPNDVPPNSMMMVTEHEGILFGVQANLIRKSGGGGDVNVIRRNRPTNIAQYSNVRNINDLLSLTSLITTFTGDYTNMDSWTASYAFPCGNMSPITNVVSFRGVLYFFKEDEIGVVEGSTIGDFQYRTVWTGSGAMEGSVIPIGNYLLAFDQALGPIMISGYSVTNLGYEAIQLDWQSAPTYSGFTTGECIAGGGRGTALVISAAWDTVNSEARWVISDYQPDPQSAIATGGGVMNQTAGVGPTFFEYVCQVPKEQPSGQFTRFTGTAWPMNTQLDRRILCQTEAISNANAIVYRSRDLLYGDYYGRVVSDYASEGDWANFDGIGDVASINMRATLPFFFGDDPEMVKRFRYLYTMTNMGSNNNDVLNFSIQCITEGSAAPQVVGSVAGSAATAGQNTITHTPVPANIGATTNVDRGAQIVVSGLAGSAPVVLEEVTIKYHDRELRSKV